MTDKIPAPTWRTSTYTPPYHLPPSEAAVFEVARRHPFAKIVTSGPDGPFLTHAPVVVSDPADRAHHLRGHMARSNPQWRTFDGETDVLIVFEGPHGYVSPAWYDADPTAPTWNYIAVHLRGRPTVIEDKAATIQVLSDTTDLLEANLNGGVTPDNWQLGPSMGYVERIFAGMVAFEMEIETIEGTFKLSQNKDDELRRRVQRAYAEDPSRAYGDLAAAMQTYAPVEVGPPDA